MTKYEENEQNKFVNIGTSILLYLNTFESFGTPKNTKKSKKVIFRDLKIGAEVLVVALKYFLLAICPKKIRRPLLYLYAGKVSNFGHPSTPPFRIYREKLQGGIICLPPFYPLINRVKLATN